MTTQAPELFKLTGAGNSLTLDVSAAAPVPMGKYPEIEFVGLDGNRRLLALRVPKASAERQLGRANLTYPDVVGKRVLFSRDPNPNDPAKSYWGLNVLVEVSEAKGNGTAGAATPRPAAPITPAAPAQPVAQAPPVATTEQAAGKPDVAKGHELYLKITSWVLGTIVPLYEQGGVPMTPEAVTSCVHTLYIQASRR